MENDKAQMLNSKAADPKNKADEIIKLMGLAKGHKIADIGAGGGFFSLKFAECVGKEGMVYSVDTNMDFLRDIASLAVERGLENLRTVISTSESAGIPDDKLDFVFMRNVTHHMKNRIEYFLGLHSILKDDARVVVIDYRKEDANFFSFHGFFGHSVKKGAILSEMEEAKFSTDKDFDILPEQHFLIFKRG